MRSAKAVVIGSGPNGLAAAITLVQAGVEVDVHEAEARPGGGLHTAELTLPGFVHDVCSAVFPLAIASPFFRSLGLPVDWIHPPAPVAHPLDDGTAVVLERDIGATMAGLGPDGKRYRALVQPLVENWAAVEPVLLGPHPPRPAAIGALVRALGPATLGRSVRAALAAASPFAQASFHGPRAQALFAGNAAHSLLPLERRPSAGFGLALTALGHAVGWPLPRGGACSISDALVGRLQTLGGRLHLSSRVDELPVADLVLADVAPRELLRIAGARLPEHYARGLARYRHGPGAFKLDWALDGPIPWASEQACRAGTVHVGGTVAQLRGALHEVAAGRLPDGPFALLGQQTIADPSRAPDAKHTAWAYTHTPSGIDWDRERDAFADTLELWIERFAPGFRDRILARHVLAPGDLQARNANLVGGDVGGGSYALDQLIFRPVASLNPYATPVRGLYLGGASTFPGGSVSGVAGHAAARAALRGARLPALRKRG